MLKGDFIEKVSFLKDASRELVQDLSMKLRPIVFTPGDVIVRAGEQGRLIYFISNGSVDVISEDGKTIQTLSDGDFFGELGAPPLTAPSRHGTGRGVLRPVHAGPRILHSDTGSLSRLRRTHGENLTRAHGAPWGSRRSGRRLRAQLPELNQRHAIGVEPRR